MRARIYAIFSSCQKSLFLQSRNCMNSSITTLGYLHKRCPVLLIRFKPTASRSKVPYLTTEPRWTTYRISTFFCGVQILPIFKKTWGLKFCVLFFCASESDKRMDFIIALYLMTDRYTQYMFFGYYRLQLKKTIFM